MALFLTPRQVAERWTCSARHVRRLCASGELRAMRLGIDAWRIAVADVESYEARHTTSGEPAPAATPVAKKVAPLPSVVDGFTLPADFEPVFPELWRGR